MRSSRYGGLAAWICVAAAPAGAQATPAPGAARQDQVQAIAKEFADVQQAFMRRVAAAANDAEREQLYKTEAPDPAKWASRLWPIIDSDPKDAAAGEALVWITAHLRRGDEQKKKAVALLTEHHIGAEGIGTVCQGMTYDPDPANAAFIRKVLSENPHRQAQGKACYALAGLLRRTILMAQPLQDKSRSETTQAAWTKDYGAAAVEAWRALDVAKTEAEVVQLLERCAADFADVEYYPDYPRRIGEVAKGDLFELRNLGIGQVAPEITGNDGDGVAFKLSDYRGKIVVLDFWGFW